MPQLTLFTVKESMDRLEMYMLEQGYSPVTRRHYRKIIKRGLREGLGKRPMDELLREMRVSAASLNSYRSAFMCWERAYGRRPSQVSRRKVPRGLPRPVDDDDLAAYLSAGRDLRERVFSGLIVYAGLRISEAVAMPWSSVGKDRLLVFGKGSKERAVPLHPDLRALLTTWRTEGDFVFPGTTDGHMSPCRMRQIHYDICDRAGIPRFVPHRARHTFACEALDVSGDIAAVAALLGHANIATTAIYAQVRQPKLVRVVEQMYGAGSLREASETRQEGRREVLGV